MNGDPISIHFNAVGLAVYPPGATFGPRTIRDFEFVWIVDGDVRWHCDGIDREAPPGTVILVRPSMRDGFTWDPRHWTRHGFIHFQIEGSDPFLGPSQDWPLMRHLQGDDIIRPLFHHIAWLLSARLGPWENLARSAMRLALSAFVTGFAGGTRDGGAIGHPVIERVLAAVEDRWSGESLPALPLSELVAASGVSRGHLIRIFRQFLGSSPVEALRLVRLDRAASLLGRTNLPIQEIASRTGFGNAFHFTKRFHACYGMSPRSFRSRLLDGMDMPTISLVQVRGMGARLWRRDAHGRTPGPRSEGSA